jgi:hypothetical protein
MRFSNSSVMIIGSDSDSTVMRLELDAETQESICEQFSSAVDELIGNKEKIKFDGKYKPESDEFLSIENFQLSDSIRDAIRNPVGVEAYNINNEDDSGIKAIFVGQYTESDENENFEIAFQRFRKEQYISPSFFHIFFSDNTFKREKNPGISILNSVDCFYCGNELQFSSFYFARQIFDLSGYYRSATDQEVQAFTGNSKLIFENATNFRNIADTSIRRKIAMINDSGVLEKYSPSEIHKLANNIDISVEVKEGRVYIPNDKVKVKIILHFLDEEAYQGPFTKDTFLTNSKRKVSQ